MRKWRITRGGGVVLGIIVGGIVASLVAPRPWSALALVIAVLLLFGVLMDTFAGRTIQTASDEERAAFFRRIYGARKRWRD